MRPLPCPSCSPLGSSWPFLWGDRRGVSSYPNELKTLLTIEATALEQYLESLPLNLPITVDFRRQKLVREPQGG